MEEINKATSGKLEMDVVVNEIISKIANHLDAIAVAVLTHNPDKKELSYFAARGFLEKYDLDKIHEPIGSFVSYWLDQNQDLIYRNTSEIKIAQPTYIQQFQDETFSSYIAHPLVIDDQLLGILEIYISDFRFDIELWQPYIEAVVSQLTNAIDNAQTYQALKKKVTKLSEALDMSIAHFVEALEKRSDHVSQNTQRMVDMTVKLARVMGADEEDQVNIQRGVLLQSITKMTLPEKIINKTSSLDEKEWDIVHKHPQMIFDLFKDISILRPALDIPYCHHEHWDGSGYPRGLSGEEIPLSARQFAVVNVFDALLTERPYRSSWQEEDALAYIRSLSGVQFDPNVVDAFINMFGRDDQ